MHIAWVEQTQIDNAAERKIQLILKKTKLMLEVSLQTYVDLPQGLTCIPEPSTCLLFLPLPGFLDLGLSLSCWTQAS